MEQDKGSWELLKKKGTKDASAPVLSRKAGLKMKLGRKIENCKVYPTKITGTLAEKNPNH